MATASKRQKSKSPRRNKGALTASTAELHDLYERAVQDPDFEVEFLTRAYREARGKAPKHFREDFCGTALTAATWVKQGPGYTADGFDLDLPTLDYGRKHHLTPLGAAADRVSLFHADVRSSEGRPADIRCAHNFSYQVFKQRSELREYFEAVYRDLADDGVFCLDMFGGSESIETVEEERWVEEDAFKYIWDQDEYLPGTAGLRAYIHFEFPDKSRLNRAFTYDWRLWTMPEVKEVLREAGFPLVLSYFEEYDEEGDGTGEFSVNEFGDACESWLAYIIAGK